MTRKRCKIIISIFILVSIFILLCFLNDTSDVDYNTPLNLSCSESILRIQRHISRALRYSRSHVVKEELLQALSLMSKDIKQHRSDATFKKIQKMEANDGLRDVCLEEFKGVIDHPLYNLGQIEIECKRKRFEDIVTFLIYGESCDEIAGMYLAIRKIYSKSRIIFGTNFQGICDQMWDNASRVDIENSAKDWIKITETVATEFVLFATNIYHFDNQSKIERLVQMISYTDVKIAAGGVRLENGKFSTGCYQMTLKMYTLKLVEGYDMSFNSCMYCDYSPAPFVTRTSYLVNHLKRKSDSQNHIFILEIFTESMIWKTDQILVCPDVMFHVKPYDLVNIEREKWLAFVTRFELNRIMFAGGKVVNFTCEESGMYCYKKKGIMVPLCCLKELSDSLKFMKTILDRQNVTFEVVEGTVMGSLKYGNILFWERDADTNFRVQMIDKLEEKIEEIENQGYSMRITYECPFRRDYEKCRLAGWHGSIYYAFKTKNWRTEMYGVTFILSDFRGKLKSPTKIQIDGEWYVTYTNPALYGRNIYGGDIFQHIEHNLVLGISPNDFAKVFVGNFQKCPRPGFHGCLDQFAGEGNLQFLDLYI